MKINDTTPFQPPSVSACMGCRRDHPAIFRILWFQTSAFNFDYLENLWKIGLPYNPRSQNQQRIALLCLN